MSDNKMFVFGSFSEDETKSFQKKTDVKSTNLFENFGFQFGSLDVNALRSVKVFGSEFKQNPASKSKNILAVSMIKKSKACEASTGQYLKEHTESKPNLTVNCSIPIYGKVITEEQINKKWLSLQSLEDEASTGKSLKEPTESKLFMTANCSSAIKGKANTKEQVHQNNNSLQHSEDDNNIRDLPCVKVQDDGLEKLNDHSLLSSISEIKDAEENEHDSTKNSAIFRGLLPRGLINLGNLCFLNSTLQALLSCSPFVKLLWDLKNRNISKAGYPTLRAFAEFISEFCLPEDSDIKINPKYVNEGRPFSPIMFETVLKKFTPNLPNGMSSRPRQEDAQEFLSFLMDQMHDELLRLGGYLSSSNGGTLPLISESDDDGWETIGRKNKSAVTRTQSFMPSELSAIFGGQFKSVVKAKGNKASATVQPFLLLHLDIVPDAIHTIEDALRFFSFPETLEGYRASSGKAGLVNASKSVKIQTLPKIMILHLMRFSYGSRGSTKLNKKVHFPLQLVIGRDLLSTPIEGRKYELEATITHHGQEHSKGHYTADCRYSDGHWLRYDDSSVTSVGLNKVLHDQAYLLFYNQL